MEPKIDQNGLQLVADTIAFNCPFGKGRISIHLDGQELNLP